MNLSLLPVFNQSITVYVPFTDPVTRITSWYRYKAPRCYYGSSRIQAFADKELYKLNKTLVRIPKRSDFIAYKNWANIPDRVNSFTLDVGCIIVKGDVGDDIPENNSGAELLKKYRPEAFIVNTFKDNTGSPGEHYFASGA